MLSRNLLKSVFTSRLPKGPVSRRKLVTSSEISDIKTRMRGLKKILSQPRASLPCMALPIAHLIVYMQAVLETEKLQYTPESRKIVDNSFKAMDILENVLIQVLMQNKNLADVILKESVKKNAEFLLSYYGLAKEDKENNQSEV